jgi:hypothetical protein
MMSETDIPKSDNTLHGSVQIGYMEWFNCLKKCEVSDSEFEKITTCIFCNMSIDIFTGNPIEVSDIVDAEYDGHYEDIIITFKQKKQIQVCMDCPYNCHPCPEGCSKLM